MEGRQRLRDDHRCVRGRRPSDAEGPPRQGCLRQLRSLSPSGKSAARRWRQHYRWGRKCDYVDVQMRGKTANVSVRFQSKLISATRDRSGQDHGRQPGQGCRYGRHLDLRPRCHVQGPELAAGRHRGRSLGLTRSTGGRMSSFLKRLPADFKKPVDFERLPGLSADRMSECWPAFLSSCARLVNDAGVLRNATASPDGALAAAERALQAATASEADIREYFFSQFFGLSGSAALRVQSACARVRHGVL